MTSASPVLTIASAKTALAEGVAAIEAGQTEFDLAGLTSVDSASVAILLAWQRAAQERGTRLQFLNPPASLLSLAGLYGVAQLLPFAASESA